MTQRPSRPAPIQQPLAPVLPQTPNIQPPNVAPLPPAPAPAPAPASPEPEPTKDGTPVSCTSRNSMIYSFKTSSTTCLQCSTSLYGGHAIDLVMCNGHGLGHENAWLRRVSVRPGESKRCDVCQKHIR